MSGYGFGKKATAPAGAGDPSKLDLSGIVRAALSVDPAREAAAIARDGASWKADISLSKLGYTTANGPS